MASDQLRKKWGTVFMGEREASEAQLDALQEPALRQRRRQQQEEDYLARVRARAEERAREILGAAYAERQKVLDEARDEAVAAAKALTHEATELRDQARAAQEAARQERESAVQLREEAARLREAAHDEGFQAGMDAAGAELTAFRQELGQSLATLLRRLEKRQDALCASWREDLTALTLAAVEAGTGWLLHSEHEAVLRRLVLEAVNLLEDRTSISVRVHPDDEASVGGLFQAARERAPELRQWVVTGDPNLEPGDLVAESGSGSVDCRRAYFSDMVAGVLTHLTLPQRPEEAAEAAALGDLVAQEAARLAAPEAVPDAPAGAESPAAATLHAVAPEAAPAAPEGPASELSAPDAPLSQPAAPTASLEQGIPPVAPGPTSQTVAPPADSPLSAPAASGTMPAELPATDPSAPAPHTATVAASAVPSESPSVVAAAESQSVPPLDEPLAPETVGAAPSAPAAAPSVDGAGAAVSAGADAAAPSAPAEIVTPSGLAASSGSGVLPSAAAAPQQSGPSSAHPAAAVAAEPSLAELEEELFPLEEDDAARNVLTQGGFLPGADHER
ncbi:FliH/SctL family protein [uncultured Desulfovibrio sp.]|nr:FliH/SctL family protein [uncultured Desulfovibrio sp.]